MSPEARATAHLFLSAFATGAGRKPKSIRACRKRMQSFFAMLERPRLSPLVLDLGEDRLHMQDIGRSVCRACGKCKGGVPITTRPPLLPGARLFP